MITCIGYLNPNSTISFFENFDPEETLSIFFIGYEINDHFTSILLNDDDNDSLLVLKDMLELKKIPKNILIYNFQNIENETLYDKTKKNRFYNTLLKMHTKFDSNLFFVFNTNINFGLVDCPMLEHLNKHASKFIFFDDNENMYVKTISRNGKPVFEIIEKTLE